MYMIDFLHDRVRPHPLKKGASKIFYVILKGSRSAPPPFLNTFHSDPSATFTNSHTGCATHKNLMLGSMRSSLSGSRY